MRLCNQHAVEGVFVVVGQGEYRLDVIRCDVKPSETLGCDVFGDLVRWQRHLAKTVLDETISQTQIALTQAPSVWINVMTGWSLISPINQS